MPPPGLGARLATSLRLGRVLRLVWSAAPGWTTLVTPLLILRGLLPLAAIYLMKEIVDTVAAGVGDAGVGELTGPVGWLVLAAAVVALLSGVVQLAIGLATEAQGLAVTDRVFSLLHEKSASVDYGYYEDPRYYDTLHRAQREAPTRPSRVVARIGQIAQSTIALVAMAAVLVSFGWIVALILVVAGIPAVLIRVKYSREGFTWARRRTPLQRRASYIHWILTRDIHAKEVRLFGLGAMFVERFRDLRDLLRRETIALSARRTRDQAFAHLLTTAALFGTFASVALATVEGAVTIGGLVMFYQAFQRGQTALRDVLDGLAGLYEDNLFLTDLFTFLELEPPDASPVPPAPMPHPLDQGIEIRDLGFSYDDSAPRPALAAIDAIFRPGEIVAIVGKSGAGKTTLLKLLCRFYRPTRGEITWDGIDYRRFPERDLHRHTAALFQDPDRYHFTARENIWFGNVELDPTSDLIEEAARRAELGPVIEGLPQGIDSPLGKWLENGSELSSGEWQRIALARALLRDATLLLLDEPTSALDATSEKAILGHLRRHLGHRIAVIISHRLSAAKLADRIYVLDAGRIVETGRHDELVAAGGLYAELYDLQSRAPRPAP